MDAPKPILELKNVSVTLGRQPVLRDLSIAIYPQETVALIGESGCGKSVTLRLMVGLLAPDRGEVLFEGRSLHSLSDRELSATRQRIGFLFQQSALFDSLTVFDNIAFGPRSQGEKNPATLQKLVRERLIDVGLTGAAEPKMPADLSGGMRKRVALARALALNPDIMFYDEPTTGLDPIMTDVINELILQTRRRRPVTGIVVTHEMRTVHKVADRVLMLQPLSLLPAGGSQLLYDGPASGLTVSADRRVREFVDGDASERLANQTNHWD